MRVVFADSAYWIALLNRRDGLHGEAVRQSLLLTDAAVVTSEMVLVEVLNYFSAAGLPVRATVSGFVKHILVNSDCQVIPQTSDQFRNALRLFHERSDKNWSLTDCASILIMESRDIREILTEDKHFKQAGFTPLLR